MEPTVGRIILVRRAGDDRIYPAIITAVNAPFPVVAEDGDHTPQLATIDVYCFAGGGYPLCGIAKTDLSQDGQGWDWMEYQKAQAGEVPR